MLLDSEGVGFMDVVSIECPNCGGHIERKGTEYFVKCPYCDVELAFDDIKEEAQIGELKDKVNNLKQLRSDEDSKRSELRKWILWRNILFGLMGALHFCGFTCVGASGSDDAQIGFLLGLGSMMCLAAWVMALALPFVMASRYPAYNLLNGGKEVAGHARACFRLLLTTVGILLLSAFAAYVVLSAVGLA